MDSGFERLADAVERVRWFRFNYGDVGTTPRLVALADQLRAGDKSAIVGAISEATGGMCSLCDRYLCPENGDRLTGDEVETVNEELDKLVKNVEREARAAASEYGIALLR